MSCSVWSAPAEFRLDMDTVLNVVVATIIEQFNEAVTREKVDDIDPMLLTGIEELDAQGDGSGVRLAVRRRGRRNLRTI